MKNNSIYEIDGAMNGNPITIGNHTISQSKQSNEAEWSKNIKNANSSTNSKQLPRAKTINNIANTSNTSYSNKTTTSSIERRYEVLITKITDGKGVAVTTLGEYFYNSNKFASRIDALEFAWEFLEFEDSGYMDTMITLIKDGWSGSFGELISCAKNI